MKKWLFLIMLMTQLGYGHTVILVHGFLRSSKSMRPMERTLRKEGYSVLNWNYPSRQKTIEGHAEDLVQKLAHIAEKHPGEPISFVTHSMGGLIVRQALNLPGCPKEAQMGKAVLLGPPNRGSSFARRLNKHSLVRKILGNHSGKQLLTTPRDGFDRLGDFPKDMEVLVITGTSGRNPLILEANDCVVEANETCLPTPHAHEESHSWHSFIMFNSEVIQKTKQFLRNS